MKEIPQCQLDELKAGLRAVVGSELSEPFNFVPQVSGFDLTMTFTTRSGAEITVRWPDFLLKVMPRESMGQC